MMNLKSGTKLLPFMMLMACGQEEQLLLPDNIEVHWDASFNARGDGLTAVVPVDLMVYDSATGEPLSGVELDLQVSAPDAYLMPTTDVSPLVSKCPDCDVLWDAYSDDYYDVQVELSEDYSKLRLEADENGLAHHRQHEGGADRFR